MSGKHLLLVEDDYHFRQLMVENLFDAGFEIAEATDGDQAISILEQCGPLDILVTDIEMPGHCDGNDVATEAKRHHPEVTVVYISGRPESLTNRLGPHDVFLDKPFTSDRMIFEIRRLLDVARTTRVTKTASGTDCETSRLSVPCPVEARTDNQD